MDWLDGMGAGAVMVRIVIGRCGDGKERLSCRVGVNERGCIVVYGRLSVSWLFSG